MARALLKVNLHQSGISLWAMPSSVCSPIGRNYTSGTFPSSGIKIILYIETTRAGQVLNYSVKSIYIVQFYF